MMPWETAIANSSILVATLLMEALGVLVILLGAFFAGGRYLYNCYQRQGQSYNRFRSALGKAILLGLELLVAADIIRSVAVEPTFRSVGVLALIVVIRTFLSFSLEVEINGRWPWQAKGWESEPTVGKVV